MISCFSHVFAANSQEFFQISCFLTDRPNIDQKQICFHGNVEPVLKTYTGRQEILTVEAKLLLLICP